VLGVSAALESQSEHPLGKAIVKAADGEHPAVRGLTNHPGAGISGNIDGKTWFIGSSDFVSRQCAQPVDTAGPEGRQDSAGIRILLADADRIHAEIVLHDETRPDAQSMITALRQAGKQLILLSGDNLPPVRQVAEEVGIETIYSDMKPQDKLDRIQALQRQGAIVTMVGDGINDAPVLAAADVSIAMHGAAQISQASADMILLSDRLLALADGMHIARRAMRIVHQNLAWALVYNLIALPAAASGYVAPWMAAIGMSSSSLLVVVNALRLTRVTRRHREPRPGAAATV